MTSHHVKIEALRLFLLHNPSLTIEQRQSGYEWLQEMVVNYLRAAGIAL